MVSRSRPLLPFDRNIPSRTSIQSGRTSVWERLTGPTVPVRSRYCARAAHPRSNAVEPPLDGLASVFCSRGRGHDPKGRQALALPRREPFPHHVLTLPLKAPQGATSTSLQ